MRQKYVIAGAGLLCLCLAGYVALAGGQTPVTLPPSPPTSTPAPEPVVPPANPLPGMPALPGLANPTPPQPALPPPGLPPATAPMLPDLPPLPAAGTPPLPGAPQAPLPGALPTAPEPMLPTTPQPSLKVPTGLDPLPVANPPALPGPAAPEAAPQPGLPAMPALPTTGLPTPPALPTPGQPTSPQPGNPLLPPPPGANPELVPGVGVPATQVQEVKSPLQPQPPVEEPVSSVTAENPGGRQEPSVSIEWQGPAATKVGMPGDYALLVRNTSNIPVADVVVRVRVPAGLQVQGTEPKAGMENNVLVWDLGVLVAKQEKNLVMKMQAAAKGDLMPQAKVSFSGSSTLRIRVREPKIVLKVSAPEKALVGDTVAFSLTVTNPGDCTVDQVKIQALLSEGLEHQRGNKVDFDIGNLSAGENRSVQLICGTRNGGPQKCECVALADAGSLKSEDAANVNVIKPHLDVAIEGPGLRYLDRKALYTLKITNPGDAPATNVTVSHVVPTGFKVLAASNGGRHDYSTRTVSWFLGEVAAAQTKEVKLEVQAINVGDHKHQTTAVGARGLRAEAEKLTRVEGLSALLVEMVDTEDPIEVGAETAYEIRITNTGSKTETDIKLTAMLPDKLEFKAATGPVRFHAEGKKIVFDSLEKLAPRADAIFRITCKGTQPGTVRFETQVTSSNLIDAVVKQEATRIYSDAPETPVAPPGRTPVAPPGQFQPPLPQTPLPGPGPAAPPAYPMIGGQPPLPGGR
jgi:uncharacterized repeat protein (TIGR01451 family)